MTGRSVIITGASTGIGRATAKRFAKSKDRLILTDSNADLGRSLTEDLVDSGVQAVFIEADLTRKLDVHNIVAEALDNYGGVQVLAHCAPWFSSGSFLETTEDDYTNVFDKNVKAAFLLNRAVAREIVRGAAELDDGGVDTAHSGAIVNVVSSEAVTAVAHHALFAATQGAIVQLTKGVALTLSPYGARANSVGIAAIKSELDDVELKSREAKREMAATTPLARRGEPEEAAGAIHFLASTEASFITGQTIFVDGGRMAVHHQTDAQNAG